MNETREKLIVVDEECATLRRQLDSLGEIVAKVKGTDHLSQIKAITYLEPDEEKSP